MRKKFLAAALACMMTLGVGGTSLAAHAEAAVPSTEYVNLSSHHHAHHDDRHDRHARRHHEDYRRHHHDNNNTHSQGDVNTAYVVGAIVGAIIANNT